MAHAYNPSTLGGRGGWITRSRDQDHPGQHGETPSLLKIQKIIWAWWYVPVIPACNQEAEAGELPEPRRQRLRWAEIAPLHSSLGNKSETPSQKKKSLTWNYKLYSHSTFKTSTFRKQRTSNIICNEILYKAILSSRVWFLYMKKKTTLFLTDLRIHHGW